MRSQIRIKLNDFILFFDLNFNTTIINFRQKSISAETKIGIVKSARIEIDLDIILKGIFSQNKFYNHHYNKINFDFCLFPFFETLVITNRGKDLGRYLFHNKNVCMFVCM